MPKKLWKREKQSCITWRVKINLKNDERCESWTYGLGQQKRAHH